MHEKTEREAIALDVEAGGKCMNVQRGFGGKGVKKAIELQVWMK